MSIDLLWLVGSECSFFLFLSIANKVKEKKKNNREPILCKKKKGKKKNTIKCLPMHVL